MAVLITDTCIEECPDTAIVSADESPLTEGEYAYVKPEKCIERIDDIS